MSSRHFFIHKRRSLMRSPVPLEGRQKLVPGIVGISTYVDYVYHREMQLASIDAAGSDGPVNRLRVVTVTLDFKQLIADLLAGRIEAAEEQVAVTAEALEAGGADFMVVTSGTTSTLMGRARQKVSMPVLDLAEAAWNEVSTANGGTIGLLSTRQAVAGGIFQAAAEKHGATLVTPEPETAAHLDDAIFGELILGDVTRDVVETLTRSIVELEERGVDAIILGNTDMTLALDRLETISTVPVIDSARAHARAAARTALNGEL